MRSYHKAPPTRTAVCSECNALASFSSQGRPRKTCGATCAMARRNRMTRAERQEDVHASQRWWLGLTEEQRLAAMAFCRREPVPRNWHGGKQGWAWVNRATFSCEGAVVSGVF